MFTKRTVLTAVGLAAVMVAGLSNPSEANEKIVFASYISEAFTSSKADIWFMDEVEKRSNGEITFERYFSGSLLGGADLYPGLKQGAADMVSGVPAAYNRADFPLSNVTLPFITESPAAAGAAFRDLVESNADLRKEFDNFNAVYLYSRSNPENVVWLNKPIRSIDEMQGKKIRAVLTIADAFEILGATTVSMSASESVDALDRGVIDGFSAIPFDASFSLGLEDISEYVSDTGRMGASMLTQVAFNRTRWESLSEEHRALLMEVAKEASDRFATELLPAAVAESVDKLCAKVKEGKIEVIRFSDEDTKRAKEMTADKLRAKWVEWAAGKSGADAQALLDQYIVQVAKHEAESRYVSGLDETQQKCGN